MNATSAPEIALPLTGALRAFPQRNAATVNVLEQALATDPEKIVPRLAMAEHARAMARDRP